MAGAVGKLIRFANKTLKATNRKNCGKLINTIEDAASGTKIEVFQKTTGSRLLGNRRTVTTRFQEGIEKPLEQTVRQKKGKVLSTYTTKNDYDETTIFTQVNTKTGEKEARVDKWLETINDEGETVYRRFTTKKVTREAGSDKTFVDNLEDYSTGEMRRTTYQRFNNDEGRGIIKEGEISYKKTFIDKDNIMHQKSALKPADESESLDWFDTIYNLEGKEWKAPATAAKASKMSNKRKAAIGIGLGVTGGTGLYIADVATSKGTGAKPVQTDTEEVADPKQTSPEEVQEETVTPTPAEEETQEEEQVEQTAEQEEETEVPAEQEEQQVQEPEQQEEEEQQPAVEENPPADNLFGGTLNEISIKQYEVQPKDCLWNIAKRELQKANPGKTVTNAHILQQVKEFIRLNPQIENPDLIYPNQKIKTAA